MAKNRLVFETDVDAIAGFVPQIVDWMLTFEDAGLAVVQAYQEERARRIATRETSAARPNCVNTLIVSTGQWNWHKVASHLEARGVPCFNAMIESKETESIYHIGESSITEVGWNLPFAMLPPEIRRQAIEETRNWPGLGGLLAGTLPYFAACAHTVEEAPDDPPPASEDDERAEMERFFFGDKPTRSEPTTSS